MVGLSGKDFPMQTVGRRRKEATGSAHGPIVVRTEGNASRAKGPWAVAGMQRTEAGTLWPEIFAVSERVEL